MEPRQSDDMVRVTTAANPVEAHLIEQVLEAEGISCKVVGDYLDASFGDMSGTWPEVWVHRNDLAAAEAAIEKCHPAATPASSETDEPET